MKLACCLAAALLVAAPSRALADATLFIGANTSPSTRTVRGGALGAGLLIIGFEVEYANTTDDAAAGAPSLTTGMGNVLLQTPVAIFRVQPYFTAGAGIAHESLGQQSDTAFGLNTGGGAKISLIGPIRLRIDYRVFKLGSGALVSPAHRVYAGLNVAF